MSDAQAAYEKTLTGLAPALAGASLIYGAGMLESGMTCDLGQLVIDNELIALIRQFVPACRSTMRPWPWTLIHEVGAGGEFVSTEHTLRHMREASQPKLCDRDVREAWQAAGWHAIWRTSARAKRAACVAEHQIEPLPDDVSAEIRRIVQRPIARPAERS